MSNANFQCILVRIHGLSQWLKRSTSPSCAFFQHFSAAVGASGLTCWRGWKIIVKTNKWSWSSSAFYCHTVIPQKSTIYYIHSHIYSSVSFHSDKVVSARDQEGRVDHGPSEAISAGQQGLGGSVLVPTYITPAFPTMLIILDSIHLIIQDTILETLPFLLRVTRLSNANNRRPDMSSSLTSVVALPAGSCSLWIRVETWHCLGTDWSFTNSQMAWVAAGVLWKVPPLSSLKSNTTTPAARMHLPQLLHHSQEHRSLWSFWMSRHLEWREFHMVCRSKMFRVTKVGTIWVVKQRQIKTSCHPKHQTSFDSHIRTGARKKQLAGAGPQDCSLFSLAFYRLWGLVWFGDPYGEFLTNSDLLFDGGSSG